MEFGFFLCFAATIVRSFSSSTSRPLMAGQNWLELAPYDRGDATKFLQSGGRELSPEAIDALFRGLDRIEDGPGLYRPITLNMVGLVLERMGHTLEGDPGRLIQSYLTACLTTSESRFRQTFACTNDLRRRDQGATLGS